MRHRIPECLFPDMYPDAAETVLLDGNLALVDCAIDKIVAQRFLEAIDDFLRSQLIQL